MIPTLRTTLGLQGPRPVVGHLDCHDAASVVGALNLVTGHVHTRIVERRRAASAQRSLHAAFVRHVRDLARTYPAARYPHVVLVIDNAPWHKGALVPAWLKHLPHLARY